MYTEKTNEINNGRANERNKETKERERERNIKK